MARANSTAELKTGEGCARSHRAAVFVAALVASAACFSLVSGETLEGSLLQGALLAAVALVAVGVSHPQALRAPRRACDGLGPWIGYLLFVGAIAGAASLWLAPVSALDLEPLRAAQVILLCLVTGVFEEGVFRVLALDALVPALGGDRRAMARAALVSVVLFGVLHVSLGEAAALDAVSGLQVVLKPLQACLFGLFMAAMYFKVRNLWPLVGVHAAFNLLYAGPLLLADVVQQTYVTGSTCDLVLLAATVVLLLPAVWAAIRSFRKKSENA